MNAATLYAYAVAATAALEGLSPAYACLGCGHDEETINGLAELLGVTPYRTVHFGGSNSAAPIVIFGARRYVGGVEVYAQGSRPATAADAGLPGFRSPPGEAEFADPSAVVAGR